MRLLIGAALDAQAVPHKTLAKAVQLSTSPMTGSSAPLAQEPT